MLNTYIKNRGITQTIINNNNNQKEFNQINWDADYDGQQANISLTSDTNGSKKQIDIQLDNEDLANMLSIPSEPILIDKRLQMDFNTPSFRRDPQFVKIVMPYRKTRYARPKQPKYLLDRPKADKETIAELVQSIKPNNYLSSPLPNEELIVPITIDNKSIDNYTLTHDKRHRRPKTHKTYKVYKVYKKPKSYSIKATGIKKYKYKSRDNSKTSKLYSNRTL
jgi:hypothetical protein